MLQGMEDDSCQSSTPKALTSTPLSKNAPPQVCNSNTLLNVIDELFNKSGKCAGRQSRRSECADS